MAEQEPLTDRFLRLAQHLHQLENHGWDVAAMQQQVEEAKSHIATGERAQADTITRTLAAAVERILRERAPALFSAPVHAAAIETPIAKPDAPAANLEDWTVNDDYCVVVDEGASGLRAALTQVHAKATTAPVAAVPVELPTVAALVEVMPAEIAPELIPPEAAETVSVGSETAVTLAVVRAPVATATAAAPAPVACETTAPMPVSASAEVVRAATDAALAALRPEIENLVAARLAAQPPPAEAGMSADALDRELDWRLERVAAERGWCSLADVETVVRRLTGGEQAATLAFARLESALLGFVQQSQNQQTRMLQHLHLAPGQSHDEQPAAPGTTALTGKLSRNQPATPIAASSAGDDEALADDEAATADLGLAPASTASLDAVAIGENIVRQAAALITPTAVTTRLAPVDALADAAAALETLAPGTAAFAAEPSAVIDEVEAALLAATAELEKTTPVDDVDPVEAALAAALQEQSAPVGDQVAELATEARSALDSLVQPLSLLEDDAHSGLHPAANETRALPASGLSALLSADELDAMLAAALGEESDADAATPASATLPASNVSAAAISGSRGALTPASGTRKITSTASTESPAALHDALRSALPGLLVDAFNDPEVRQQILGIVAAEMVTNPGVLGEITGIRSFLQRELAHAATNLQPAAHGN